MIKRKQTQKKGHNWQLIARFYVSVTVHREQSTKKEYQQDATICMIYCQLQMLIID